MPLRITLIGNAEVRWSTANDLRDTLERLGHSVDLIHEPDEVAWNLLLSSLVTGTPPDAVIWNRTPSHSRKIGHELQELVLEAAVGRGIPTIAYHLDRWWGLDREFELFEEPYFRCQWVFTADGHLDDRWKSLGINHFWLPPAIAPRNVGRSSFNHRFAHDVLFMGSQRGYHREWTHRNEMIRWLKRIFRDKFVQFPSRQHPAIRDERLGKLYASSKVVIGDSCLVPGPGGTPWTRYCSDRVFETVGRGGFLLHPEVKGVIGDDALLVPDVHLDAWRLGDFMEMIDLVKFYLKHDELRQKIARQGFEHVSEYHSYANRLKAVLRIVGLTKGVRS